MLCLKLWVRINENVIYFTHVTLRASLTSLKTVKDQQEEEGRFLKNTVCLLSWLSTGHVPAHLLQMSDEAIKRGDGVYWSLRGKPGHCSRTELEIKIKSTAAAETERVLKAQTAPGDNMNCETAVVENTFTQVQIWGTCTSLLSLLFYSTFPLQREILYFYLTAFQMWRFTFNCSDHFDKCVSNVGLLVGHNTHCEGLTLGSGVNVTACLDIYNYKQSIKGQKNQ